MKPRRPAEVMVEEGTAGQAGIRGAARDAVPTGGREGRAPGASAYLISARTAESLSI